MMSDSDGGDTISSLCDSIQVRSSAVTTLTVGLIVQHHLTLAITASVGMLCSISQRYYSSSCDMPLLLTIIRAIAYQISSSVAIFFQELLAVVVSQLLEVYYTPIYQSLCITPSIVPLRKTSVS